MTKQSILSQWESMTPRERDALVAEKVMNLCVLEDVQGYGDGCVMSDDGFDRWILHPMHGKVEDPELLPPYSTNISAAFEVWEHDRPEDWVVELTWSNGKYTATIIKQNFIDGYKYLAQEESESAAEAMVKCRLLAVMDE